MLRIITAAIAGSVIIFVICTLLSKKGWPKIPGTGAGWKKPFVFMWRNFLRPKKLIVWTLIISAGYGMYLLANYCTQPKSERLFKKIIINQIEVQTKDETGNLEKMAESSGTNTLSPDELRLAQKNRLGAAEKRKKLETMLNPIPPKQISARVKEEWVMSLMATDKKMEEENEQKPYYEVSVCELISTDFEIVVDYISTTGKKETTKLTRWSKDHFYGGWIKNVPSKKKRSNISFSLLKDEEPSYEIEGSSGIKFKIFPQFKGYLGKNEIEVKVFKRVSSG